MQILSHNEPLVREMLKAYWANYRIKPDAAEIEASFSWGMSLDKGTLEYALDLDNHSELAQNRNPRLVDLKRLANMYREARGDFYRQPLPDTSLPEEPECLYCAEGDVYDFVIKGEKWKLEKVGRCAVCSGGMARTNPVFIEMAELYNINVGEAMWHFSLALLEYKFKYGLMKIPGAAIEDALDIFRQYYADKIATQLPKASATPVKQESGTQVCLGEETAPESKDYDFGDGFERENPTIPF